MRVKLAVCLLLLLAPMAHAQRAIVEIVAVVDLKEFIGRPANQLATAILGRDVAVRYSFETLHNGAHIGVIDTLQLGQERCRGNNGISGAPMLTLDGVAVGTTGLVRPLLSHGFPPRREIYDLVDGAFRRVAPDVTRDDPAAPLPLAMGNPQIATLVERASTTPGTQHITCRTYSGRGSTEGNLQTLVLLPFVLARPLENQSREAARITGPALYDSIALGAPLANDLASRARDERIRLRIHADGDYQVVTIDFGGRTSRGIAQPRGLGYIGVRNGVVEWKAVDPTGNALSDILCVAADGRRGRVRPGCSSTGFYFP